MSGDQPSRPFAALARLGQQPGVLIAGGLILFGLLLWNLSPPPGIRPPLSVDLPFDSLMTLRRTLLSRAADSAPILAGLGVVGLIVIAVFGLIRRRMADAIAAAVITLSALLALQAQVHVQRGEPDAALAFYVGAGALFCVWMLITRKMTAPASSLSRRVELTLLTIVLAVTIFARIYEIKRMPYGTDGDETKWTIEVVSTMVDGSTLTGMGAEYHRRYLPMSFWLQAPFQWTMGVGLTPGRISVAVFSILASFFFYRLVRELFDTPTALVATLLLGVSLADITASRAANVESYTKLWAILPFYGIAVALRTRRLRHFFLTGFAVAGAMWTYETMMPVVAATLCIAIGAALVERREWKAWVRRIAALATVPAALAFVTIDYLLGRMQYYQDYRSVAEGFPLGEQLARGVKGLLDMFSAQPGLDWLYYRDGPYINGLLVPLLFLGVVFAIARARRTGNAIALTWAAWVFIPVPIILHTPLPRILYPGLPALYIFVAVAMLAIYRALAKVVHWPRTTRAIGVVALGSFALLNLTIWFQEVTDPMDELRRREVAEIVAATIHPGGPLLMPYVLPGETVDAEQDFARLMIYERRGTLDAGEFRAIPYGDLLPTLSELGGSVPSVNVLVDTTQVDEWGERAQILDAFRRCYTSAPVMTPYFQLYTAGGDSLQHPACRSARLSVTSPPSIVEGGSAMPIQIGWSIDAAPATQAELTCGRDRDGIVWIEAETFTEREGWIGDVRFVTTFSGTGYLADEPDSTSASTMIEIPQSGTYRVWVRSYRRQDDPFAAFVEIAGRTLVFAEPETGVPEYWRWQRPGDVDLNAGPLSIRLTRPFDTTHEPFIALFVDAIVLSRDPNFDPQRDDRWQPVLQLREQDDKPTTSGTFQAHLEPGSYYCKMTVSDGERLLDKTGTVGLTSDPIYFQVMP
ncbi:MAG TPA: glycosyltransferase family 39 protein [Anaerolineae bacterium]